MSYPRYPAYKESGVPWLGQVPAHWEVKRLKSMLERNDSGVWGEIADEGTLALRSTEQTVGGGWRIEDPARIKIGDADKASALLRAGDLVITKSSGSEAHIGKTSLVTADVEALECVFSNFMQRLRLCADASPILVHYLLNSPIGREQFVTNSNSTTGLANLNGTTIGNLRLALPPPAEQAAIAAYLDRETAQIDALVARLEQLVALLQEKRQALISHAVTRGLDPTVPMRESGVEWLGEVPSHWETKRLRHLSPKIAVGVVVNPSSYFADEGVPFLYGSNVSEGMISIEGCRRIPQEVSDNALQKSRLMANDLVTVRVGYPGVTAVVPSELEGANCASMMIIGRSSCFNSHWLCYAMNSRVGRSQVEAVQYGAAQEQFNIGHAVDFWFSCPPPREQEAIVKHLDHACAHIANLMTTNSQMIALLQERRAALITAAVTGQIFVANG